MKKCIAAVLCALVLAVNLIPAAAALTGEQTLAADKLNTLGLVNGTGSGYDLNRSATRAEAVSLIVRLAGGEQSAASGSYHAPFADVPAWAQANVSYAYACGWVAGTSETTFSPNRAVSADEFFTFLLRILGYQDSNGDFVPGEAALFARHIGLSTVTSYSTFTRGDLFEAMLSALTFPKKGSTETLLDGLIANGLVSQAAANALGLTSESLTARQISDRCSAAVFFMECYATDYYRDTNKVSSTSSGFFITADGIAVTNYHSIDGMAYANITLITGEKYPVEKVLYYDAGEDIAVLRISTLSAAGERTSAFSFLPMVSSDTVRNGDITYAIGSPLGLQNSVTSGVVSSSSRTIEGFSIPVIQNTASISTGSSGGALFNEYGQVIGITSAYLIYGNNMYLAVPMDPVLKADLSVPGKTLEQVKNIEKTKSDAA